ncbi:MAG: NAD(P)H-hydrate epimerase, partial [Hyphomicrobiaceae bacterium]
MNDISTKELLTNQQMSAADEAAVASGVPSLELMENAGCAVADVAERLVAPEARIIIACGPGNNGGDGFVAARHLQARGFRVDVGLLGSVEQLRGDAGEMANAWQGETADCDHLDLGTADLLIDALFGAGLTRPLDGPAATVVARLNAAHAPILSVDVPSGLDGSTGQAHGPVVSARATISFFRPKPGHLLLPGRALCGDLHIADIGIPDHVLEQLDITTFRNAPPVW